MSQATRSFEHGSRKSSRGSRPRTSCSRQSLPWSISAVSDSVSRKRHRATGISIRCAWRSTAFDPCSLCSRLIRRMPLEFGRFAMPLHSFRWPTQAKPVQADRHRVRRQNRLRRVSAQASGRALKTGRRSRDRRDSGCLPVALNSGSSSSRAASCLEARHERWGCKHPINQGRVRGKPR